jgi:hypothetical protein
VTQTGADPDEQDRFEAAYCQRMISILDAQIEDLASATQELENLRQCWLGRLQASLDGKLTLTGNRAPHGAITAHILDELRSEKSGLSVAELSERMGSTLPRFNRRSIQNALGRLKRAGAVRNQGRRWAIADTSKGIN